MKIISAWHTTLQINVYQLRYGKKQQQQQKMHENRKTIVVWNGAYIKRCVQCTHCVQQEIEIDYHFKMFLIQFLFSTFFLNHFSTNSIDTFFPPESYCSALFACNFFHRKPNVNRKYWLLWKSKWCALDVHRSNGVNEKE